MLRRAHCRLSAVALRSNRLSTLHNVRLASFQPKHAKTAPPPPITYHKTQHKPSPLTTPSPPPPKGRDRISISTYTIHVAKWALVAFLAFHIFTEYFYLPSESYGVSMLPTINSAGDWLWISKYYRRGRGIQVGDIVSFKNPVTEGESAVKRVIGLEGDFVLMNTPGSKSTAMLQVPEGHCWVVGDDMRYSRDSRMFGPLPMALINGKAVARFRLRGDEVFPRFSRLDQGLQDSDEYENAVD